MMPTRSPVVWPFDVELIQEVFKASDRASGVPDLCLDGDECCESLTRSPATSIHDLPEELYSRIWDFILEPGIDTPPFTWELDLDPSQVSVVPIIISGQELRHYARSRGRRCKNLLLINRNARNYIRRRYTLLKSIENCKFKCFWVDLTIDVFALVTECDGERPQTCRAVTPNTTQLEVMTVRPLTEAHARILDNIKQVVMPDKWLWEGDLPVYLTGGSSQLTFPTASRWWEQALVDAVLKLPRLETVFILVADWEKAARHAKPWADELLVWANEFEENKTGPVSRRVWPWNVVEESETSLDTSESDHRQGTDKVIGMQPPREKKTRPPWFPREARCRRLSCTGETTKQYRKTLMKFKEKGIDPVICRPTYFNQRGISIII